MRSRCAAVLVVSVLLAAACAAPEDAGGGAEPDEGAAGSPGSGQETAAASGGEESEGQDTGQDEGPILVGLNIELSGPAAVQGQAYANAAELWVEQTNAGGGILGREVELEVLDNGSEQTEAVVLTNQLAERGATAMVGPGTSPTTLAAMDVILSTGIPTFSMGSAESIVEPASERPNVFKTPLGSRPNVEAAIEYLTGQGVDAVGVIAVNNPYGDSGVTAWEQVTGEPGAAAQLVGVERFEADDTDMTAQLNNLVSAGAEAIAVVAIPPGAPTVRRNAVDGLGLDLPMVFDAGAGAELFIELAGPAADGALVTHPPTLIWDEVDQDDPQYEALQEFGTAYTEEYGAMSGFAGYAWDALGLLRAAIEDAGSTEYGAIVESLEGLGEYVGVDGVYRLSEEDHQGLDAEALRVLTVQDGEWTLAEGAGGGG